MSLTRSHAFGTAVVKQDSCSRKIAMICSSENLPLRIIRLLLGSTDSSSDQRLSWRRLNTASEE